MARPLTAVFAIALVVALATTAPASAHRRHHGPRVLTVGTWHGKRGEFATIQAAVDAASPGDWILVGPGDYHERGDYTTAHAPQDGRAGAGVIVTGADKAGIHIRGMDRNRVVIDGTKPGAPQCSSSPADQDLGPVSNGQPLGRNGIEVFKTDGVSIENLTACNFLEGSGGGGNEIWFNGGDGSGQIGLGPFLGAFLSATSTYYGGSDAPAAAYGIFVSNSRGPGLIERAYASNMNDASFYVGACPDCNTVLDRVHAQYSALGYSGTNSGGHLVLQRSEWDHNKTGISTNSQNNDDAPSPQSGLCPGTTSYCTVFRDNRIHDNNNPNVPEAGSAAFGPTGTGIVVAGGRFDTIAGNRIYRNGAWGVLLVPYPDSETPPPISHCEGGQPNTNGFLCYYDDWGNRVLGNRFADNGFFGNPSNGDTGEVSGTNTPGNCYRGNTDPNGLTTDPPNAQQTHADCSATNTGEPISSTLAAQVICDTGLLGPCPPTPGMSYPQTTQVQMPPLAPQRTMRNPCAGVPSSSWCPGRRPWWLIR